MNELWNSRTKQYQKMVMRYLKYVLNDHLILALLFFGGGIGLAYSNWLKEIHPGTWYIKPLVLIGGVLLTLLGNPVLLLKLPDKVFLVPKEKDIHQYLGKSVKRSLISVVLPTLIGNIILFPLLALEYHHVEVAVAITATIFLGGMANVLRKYQTLYFDTSLSKMWFHLLVMLIAVGLGTWISPMGGLILMAINLIFRVVLLNQVFKTKRFNWNYAIDLENSRMQRLYHFFSLFTNVKQVGAEVKRRKYADGLVHILSGKPTLFTYLYPRIMIRSGNQGSLMLRLLLLGMVIEDYSQQIPLKVIVGGLTIYLMVIQMVDIYRPVHENVFIKIYPVSPDAAEKDLLSVMKRIILISAIFLTLIGLISNLSWNFLVASVVTQGIVAVILLKWFIPRYIKKLN
ncbi:ABC transporter permease [Pediococcus pentosaceus]|uniref:ABC transporter permease n=1 Tax=Pediococcus pentosaceus TaxID=1255 RepID=UPI0018A164AF|nr:ABC transporter permease [Pediococcus pentosaceus]MBF7137505.1 ABC transporter permease [Pediococcus pentosaceus]